MSDLNALHHAISATVQAAIPQFETIQHNAVVQPDTPLPALFHSIIGLKPGTDPVDGHSRIVATFEGRIHTGAALEATTLAAQLMVLLRKQYWDIDFVEEARAVLAQPVDDGWVVQWEQVLHLGEVQWPWPNQPRGSLVFAFDPDSGPEHEGAYKKPEDFA